MRIYSYKDTKRNLVNCLKVEKKLDKYIVTVYNYKNGKESGFEIHKNLSKKQVDQILIDNMFI